MIPKKVKKEIKYIGFYDLPSSKCHRVSSLPAIDKMDYICGAVNRSGRAVHLVSPAWFSDSVREPRIRTATTILINGKKRITLCPSVGIGSGKARYIKIVMSLLWLFFWLLIHVRRDEKVLVYHSPWFSQPIRWAKFIKRFKLILEVEEVYGQVWSINSILRKWEQKLLECADNYIAVSDILAEMLGEKTKIVLYGNYGIQEHLVNKPNDGEIKVVYAGSIDHVKGGAYNAIECARFLPRQYVIHICGYGGLKEIRELEWQIAEVNRELGRKACLYHGLLPGKEFIDFLKTCHIAINPQLDGDNMTTAFPSKLLKYLANNLPVVTTRINSIDKSPLAPLVQFSEDSTPEALAKAIQRVDLNSSYDCQDMLRRMDNRFVEELELLLK